VLLNGSRDEDLARWLVLWKTWPEREIFAHPVYVKLFCRETDQAVCAAYEGKQGGVLYPLILRPLESEPWADRGTGLADLVSPYGYGGPFYWGDVVSSDFWNSFNAWAKSTGIVSCFTRLSLFAEQILPVQGSIEKNAPNIVRVLNLPLEALWMQYEHKVRKNVKRARSDGVTVEMDFRGAKLDEFMDIYSSTMQRRMASESYFFSADFFRTIINELPGQYAFFHAIKEGRMISSELVLISVRYLYSFLGGTLSEAFASRPNDLLKHHIIHWGLETGKTAFVLGGGYGGPDGIFRFKRSFAPDGEVSFFVNKMIWNEGLYKEIMEMRRKYEASKGITWVPRPAFFPEYRGRCNITVL
jgi:hypothetical protein